MLNRLLSRIIDIKRISLRGRILAGRDINRSFKNPAKRLDQFLSMPFHRAGDRIRGLQKQTTLADRKTTEPRVMKHIVLISCTKRKLPYAAPAENLYDSPLFRFSLAYARTLAPDAIFVLSAKHGLVGLDQVIAPYEQTLKKMSKAERTVWSQSVLQQLARTCSLPADRFTILAGLAYHEMLTPALPNHSLPLDGLGQGKRLQFLKRLLETATNEVRIE